MHPHLSPVVLLKTSLVGACQVLSQRGAYNATSVRRYHESDEWPSSVMDGEHLRDARRCPPGDIPDNGVAVRFIRAGTTALAPPSPRTLPSQCCWHAFCCLVSHSAGAVLEHIEKTTLGTWPLFVHGRCLNRAQTLAYSCLYVCKTGCLRPHSKRPECQPTVVL